MQYFQDSATQKVYAFDPSVQVTDTAGVYSFATGAGVPLTNLPTTLQPCPNNTPPAPPALTLAQQAQAALGAGIAITSAGTPALNATYPANGPIWQDLKDEANFIASFAGFSTGTGSMAFALPSGATVTFTATAQLQAVVKAIGMYVSALKAIIAANPASGSLPPASATIA